MAIVITRDKMIKALEWVLTQVDPDYAYPNYYCSYVQGKCGDCLFGRALIYLGVDVDFLRQIDRGYYPGNMETAGISGILRYFNELNDEEFPDEDLIDACRLMQMYQDDGVRWVDCVHKGKERLSGKHIIS